MPFATQAVSSSSQAVYHPAALTLLLFIHSPFHTFVEYIVLRRKQKVYYFQGFLYFDDPIFDPKCQKQAPTDCAYVQEMNEHIYSA